MEWEKQQQQQQQQEDVMNGGGGVGLGGGGGGGNGMFVKVMSDEQMETLRKQIAAYATICEKLVEWHKSLTSHPEFSGARLGNLYCDPLVTSVGHKITGRQRWTPTPVQLQILERIFDQGTGTPSKQKIKEITSELTQHGQISETNVYNWFQNRRARSKRKQQAPANNNGESEVETEVESSNEKQHTKSEDFPSQPNLAAPRPEDLCFQNPEISSAMHSVDSQANKVEQMYPSNKVEQMYPSNGCSKPGVSMGQMSYYDDILAAPRIDHLVGKMEVSGSYNQYMQQDEYNLTS